MTKVKFLPYDQQKTGSFRNWEELQEEEAAISQFSEEGRNYFFFESGTSGIHYLMHISNIKREDEVWITTTSNTSFVASCVTCTIFNYGKVSRVLTDKTKLIWVIHEFGFPHPDIEKIVIIGKERGIPVIEDSAHSLNSYYKGKRLGTFGDYALYSLPKSYPVTNGGIITGYDLLKNKTHYDKVIHQEVKKRFAMYYPYTKAFTSIRRKNFEYLASHFKDELLIYSLEERVDPFVFAYYDKNYQMIYNRLSDSIELGRTHVGNQVLIPIHPLVKTQHLDFMISQIKSLTDSISI